LLFSVLYYIKNHINSAVYDPKGIQGDINTLTAYERASIKAKANTDYDKACKAIALETQDKDMEASIKKWREIFGDKFPSYG